MLAHNLTLKYFTKIPTWLLQVSINYQSKKFYRCNPDLKRMKSKVVGNERMSLFGEKILESFFSLVPVDNKLERSSLSSTFSLV